MVEIGLCHLPEIGHGWERVVAAHRPHRVSIRTCDEDILRLFQRQYTIVFQQDYRLSGDSIGRLALLWRVECNLLCAVQVGVFVEQTCTELMAQHVFHGTLKDLGLNQSLIDGLLEMLIVRPSGEIHIVASIDGGCSLVKRIFETGQLVNSGIVAHHHAVEAEIAAQDVGQYLAVGYAVHGVTIGIEHGVITWHEHLAASQADHRLVG